MTDLTANERAVLQAMGELEPATLEEIAVLTKLPPAEVKQILERLAKKGLLDSVGEDESQSG